MSKKELYDDKYERLTLTPSPYFKKQFDYIHIKYFDKKPLHILDLGGGTGEYSKLLEELDQDVTLFDFSEQAVQRAKNIGVLSVICDNFLTYDFKEKKYDAIFVKGFSLLNTDNKETFLSIKKRMRSILKPDGKIIYMGQTDLSYKWTDSGWYQLGENEIDLYFDEYLILPAFRYQTKMPLMINRSITKLLTLFSVLPKSMTLVGIIK